MLVTLTPESVRRLQAARGTTLSQAMGSGAAMSPSLPQRDMPGKPYQERLR